ncbi:tetratricopeptide repeat protein [Legionella worsleiensis]|uniref:Photosystem I assembly protein Ycf3 n=1 Tax=Legionella worsleiensis TaxID=45076 RepID=A0A0W1AFD7_9GAMM|nr:tetratricopeptide repeat protein [Legionella worsleiensis]KTD80047.1 photosystem I assembly protein Ycf3 [Legionella worsleiensis]STY32520.1 photosystem I assembly protein Ycf3 [Legionella worsleiensis]
MFNSFHIDGVKAFDANNYALAQSLFLQAINQNPEVGESYLYLGKCCFFLDDNQRAISSLNKYIELRKNTEEDVSNLADAYDLLGQCYDLQEELSAALNSYQTATQIYPSGASAWNNMGLLYIKLALSCLESDVSTSSGMFSEAFTCISKALNFCSDSPVLIHSLASWYEHYTEVLKRIIKDEDAVEQAVARSFVYAIDYYRKALSVCQEQNPALKMIITSNLTECIAQYGHHLYRNCAYSYAQDIYHEALQFDPEHLVVINQMGMCFYKQQRFSEAREYFSTILKKTADHQEIADAWLNIACTFRMERQWGEAENALHQARTHAPEDMAITEEEAKLKESMASHSLASSTQTLFGGSSSAAMSAEHQQSNTQFGLSRQ